MQNMIPGGAGCTAFFRRLWAALSVRAARLTATRRGTLGLLLAGLCAVGALIARLWLGILAGLDRLEGCCRTALRSLLQKAAGFRLPRPQLPKPQKLIAPGLLLVALFWAYAAFGDLRPVLEVSLDGQVLGCIDEKSDLDAVTRQVEQRVLHHLGTPYRVAGDFTYRLTLARPEDRMDPVRTADLLLRRIDGIANEYVLTLNGAVVGANQSKMGLILLKERLLEERVTDHSSTETQFVQDLEVTETTVARTELRSLEDIRTRLTANRTEAGFYTVAAGDTVSAISMNHGMTTAQVMALNPGLDVDKIGIGDKLLLTMAQPMLTVEEVRVEAYSEAVPYEEEQRGNDSMYVIDSRILQKGEAGAADVVARVTYHNGVEAGREILSYTVTKEPIPQIKEVGTKDLPAWWPTGSFINPCPGYVYISSNFGYRKSLGDNHTGIDLAANTGTPIYAADGGTVKVSGRVGNYGYVVYIDHGNGYVTRYAHCSKLLVKVGQKVAQGEKIALVGNTGRSTGPHLHFEIRYDGVAKNPKNYQSFKKY